jgi:uncharacterized protein YutE (UPF0331/DUF86 family)
VISPEDLDSIEDPLELFRLSSIAISHHQEAIDRLADIRARSMAALHARGSSYKELARTLGLSTPRVGQLVTANDAAAIEVLKAWAAIEQTMADIAASTDVTRRSVYRDALQTLRQSKQFSEAAARDLDDLRQLRNAVVHGRQNVSPEEAARMADKAIYLNALMRVISTELQSTDVLTAWTEESLQRLQSLDTRDLDHYRTGWWSCSYILNPVEAPVSLPALRRTLRDIRGKETGWPVWVSLDGHAGMGEAIVGDTLECWLRDVESADFWRADQKGRMFLLRRLQEDYDFPGVQPGSFLDLTLPIWGTGECLLHASRLAERLKATTVEVEMAWHGLAGRELRAKAGQTGRSLMPGKVCRDSEVKARLTVPSADIKDSLPELVKELVSPLYARFDFFEPRDELYTSELHRMRSTF